MRKIIAVVLMLLFLPAVGFGEYRGGYRHGPDHSYYGPRAGHYEHFYGHQGHGYYGRHDDDEWVAPLVIFGGLLGVMALSQMNTQPPPLPPQRICRDAYDYYDQNGQYLYTRYVDRPCR